MEDSEPFSPANQSQVSDPHFRAVQGDPAITCVDWQAFPPWQDGDPAFAGVTGHLDAALEAVAPDMAVLGNGG